MTELIIKGKRIYITGKVNGYSKRDIEDKVEQKGGIYSSFKKSIDYLFIGDNPGGSKLAKAETWKIKIRPISDLLNILFNSQADSNEEENQTPKEEINAEQKPIRPMLAKKWDLKIDPKGYLASKKHDGMRGMFNGEVVHSRQGNVINVPKWYLDEFPPFPLDGEFTMGPGTFQKTVSIVKKTKNIDEDGWKQVNFMVFDAPFGDNMTPVTDPAVYKFENRYKFLKKWIEEHNPPHIKLVKQRRCKGLDDLNELLDLVLAKRYEGIMLRKPGSAYKGGRTDILLKVKKMHDAEARVIKHVKGTGKHSERMGAIVVKMANGIEFKLGTGFSDKERENPPPVGSIVTFKYQEMTDDGVPRFASFLRVRTDIDRIEGEEIPLNNHVIKAEFLINSDLTKDQKEAVEKVGRWLREAFSQIEPSTIKLEVVDTETEEEFKNKVQAMQPDASTPDFDKQLEKFRSDEFERVQEEA